MKSSVRSFLILALAGALAWPALAQPGQGKRGGDSPIRAHPPMHRPMPAPGGMSAEERERLRRELNSARHDVYRNGERHRALEPARLPHRPLPPEERERLRRDIREANREFDRRR